MEGVTASPPSANSLCPWTAGLGNAGQTNTATVKLYLSGLSSCCAILGVGVADLLAFEDPASSVSCAGSRYIVLPKNRAAQAATNFQIRPPPPSG